MGDGQVVPFRRRGQPRPAAAPRVPPPTGRAVAAEQNADGRIRYAAAARQQKRDRQVAKGVPVPARITVALGELAGSDVDLKVGTVEGNPAGDVDAWEDVDDPRLPDREQVRLLAALTGWPVSWFYEPFTPVPMRVWVCWRGKRGCELVDDDGVPKPPGKEPGQHLLPGMPDVDAVTPAGTSTPRSRVAPGPGAPARWVPARRPPAPAGKQLVLPPGRLSDEERAKLTEALEAARKNRH
jgi:hypothetical protein